jgi:hypothetical protein
VRLRGAWELGLDYETLRAAISFGDESIYLGFEESELDGRRLGLVATGFLEYAFDLALLEGRKSIVGSRKNVPPSACSKRPTLVSTAPANAPRT